MLFPVGSNPLLDFVRRDHSIAPEPETLIISSNTPTARWRIISTYRQLWMLREAHTMQVARAGERVLRCLQRTHRLMAMYLTKELTLDAARGSEHSTLISTQEKL